MNLPTDIVLYLTSFMTPIEIARVAAACRQTRAQIVNNAPIVAGYQLQNIFKIEFAPVQCAGRIIDAIYDYAKRNVSIENIIYLILQNEEDYPRVDTTVIHLTQMLGNDTLERIVNTFISPNTDYESQICFIIKIILYFGKDAPTFTNLVLLCILERENELDRLLKYKERIREQIYYLTYSKVKETLIKKLYQLDLIDISDNAIDRMYSRGVNIVGYIPDDILEIEYQRAISRDSKHINLYLHEKKIRKI